MIVYNIALTIALTILAMTLYFVVDYFKDKVLKLKVRISMLNDRTEVILKTLNDNILAHKEKDRCVGVGRWKRFSDETCYWYACSICHNKVPKSQYGTDYFSPYCPACGAKMELESEAKG